MPTPKKSTALKKGASSIVNQRTTIKATEKRMLLMKHSSGPLPAAEEFEHYGKVLESAPERILSMAEKTLDTNLDNSKRQTDMAVRIANRGQIFSFIVIICALLIGTFLIYLDKIPLGVIIIGVPISLGYLAHALRHIYFSKHERQE